MIEAMRFDQTILLQVGRRPRLYRATACRPCL